MSEKHLILPISRIPSVGEFLKALHIRPDTFASQLFTAVHNHFFSWSIDLRIEYEQYYCVEYPTLASYLELSHEIVLEPAALEKVHILKIDPPFGILDEAYDDNVIDIVVKCLVKLEDGHEV